MNKKLSKLLQKYPDAKLYTFTWCEVVGEDYGYWLGKIKKIYYGKWWEYDEHIYFNFQDLTDAFEDNDFTGRPIEHEGIIILINI